MKKTLKTILVIAMLSIVIISMTACGKKEENNVDNKKEENRAESINETNKNNTAVVKNNQTTTDDNNTTGNETKTTDISRGEWNGNQYVNEFANIKFNLPSGWSKYSDEQIAQVMNVGVELLNDDQKKLAELAQSMVIYGMVANDDTTKANVSVLLEKPTMKITPESYATSLKQQLEAVSSIQYKVNETATAKVGSEEYIALTSTASVSGVEIGQSYYIRAEGDYIITIIVTTTGEGQLDTILKCFE
jgi:uncharacterized protein YxeA/uncharacterized protein YejL (UPF0352 family)